jgi:hypothetical protein
MKIEAMFSRAAFCALTMLPTATGGALAQTIEGTGSGDPLGSIQEIRKQIEEQWDGRPGQVVKGAAGVVGMAAALSAAKEAVSYEGMMRGDGSVSGDSGIGTTPDGGGTTSTSSTTSTS